MRRASDGVAAQTMSALKEDPLSGHVFVSRNRGGDRAKVLFWDGHGMCLYYKRQERGRFVVHRHARPKLSCRSCGTIGQEPMPSLPIERGTSGPGPTAHVLVSNSADHLPLYRQAQIYEREGVYIGRSAAPYRFSARSGRGALH